MKVVVDIYSGVLLKLSHIQSALNCLYHEYNLTENLHMKINLWPKAISALLCIIFTSGVYATILPNPELTGDDGKTYHLKDYLSKGKWTAVIVWGPKCPACIREMPVLEDMYEDREETGIDVVGLVLDYPSFSYAKLEQVRRFKDVYSVTFPSLLISADIYNTFNLGWLRGTPTIVMVDPQGKVSAVRLGGLPRDSIVNYISQQKAKRERLKSSSAQALAK
ncbi:MAG TPA: TlpA family protein disulfide reductase [Gammaproteobacteria bacterium]|nr:TlpA family protein disulfide reductase [Gammaproteobacteria bacterium]